MKSKRKMMLSTILLVMILALGGIVGYYWYNNTYYVSTEDAKITGDFVKVVPLATGRLTEFNIKEGDKVTKNQLIGKIEASGSGSILRAPISGEVLKVSANVGDFLSVSSAPTLAIIVAPQKIYISANIEETKLNKIKAGQPVDIAIDQYEGEKFTGTVDSVGEAANSAFSMISSSTSGTFTKVVQKVPVKIAIDPTDTKLLPGNNAVVKIHIK